MLARKRSSLKLSLVMPFVVLIALLTGSLGVRQAPSTLLKHADQDMYRDKKASGEAR